MMPIKNDQLRLAHFIYACDDVWKKQRDLTILFLIFSLSSLYSLFLSASR